MRLLLVLALLATSAFATQKRYDGYQMIRVVPSTNAALDILTNLYNQRSDVYDFWTEPRDMGRPVDIMMSPTMAPEFAKLMKTFNVDYQIKIADVQSSIEASYKDVNRFVGQPRIPGSAKYALNWDSYSDLPVIQQFLTELAASYPNLVTLSVAGQSYEGNDMHLVKISTGGTGKKAIFVDGGIHAREWISPAFVTWLIHELVENYAAHPQYVDNIDWYIMPVINPDGYRHTFAADRLWRKNRRPNAGSPCIGVDMNRNFGFHWDEGGSSDLPCGETYNGGAAFSEIESQVVRDTVLSIAGQTAVYLTVHSYGQYWLTPWGYTSALPDDYPQLYDLALRATDALTAVYGTRYTIGSSTNVLYVASGGSDDWAKGGAGIPYSYTLELRDTGTYGFELPASQIMPNNLEVWEAIKVVAEDVMNMK